MPSYNHLHDVWIDRLLAHYALAFDDGEDAVATRQSHGFGRTAGPLNFYFIDLRCRAQSEMQSLIVLRSVARAADHILPLPQLAGRHISNRAGRISRTLLC